MPRTVKIRNELILLNGLVILLILIINILPASAFRTVLGLPFVLFLPGYTLVAALFPRRMDAVERIGLSFGMSIAVVPLIGLILNYTSFGVRLEPVLYATAGFILIMSAIAWLRRRRVPVHERFNIEFELKLPGWAGSPLDKALSLSLTIAIVAMLGTMTYALAVPINGEKFTDFYILGSEGKAADYPRQLAVEQPGKIILGIVNNERKSVIYEVVAKIDDEEYGRVGPLNLAFGDKWEQPFIFTPRAPGNDKKLEFVLYKDGKSYQVLHIWLDITP